MRDMSKTSSGSKMVSDEYSEEVNKTLAALHQTLRLVTDDNARRLLTAANDPPRVYSNEPAKSLERLHALNPDLACRFSTKDTTLRHLRLRLISNTNTN